MLRSQLKRKIIAEINVVPYIDVMLVLLVIFMITTPLINQGVEVNLPAAKAKALTSSDALPLIVTVKSSGKLYLNIANDPHAPIAEEILQAEVAAALINNPKRKVMVKADKRVIYDIVLQVMVALQQAGADGIGLQTSDLS